MTSQQVMVLDAALSIAMELGIEEDSWELFCRVSGFESLGTSREGLGVRIMAKSLILDAIARRGWFLESEF